ncbi:MAG: serine hydrolase [Vicinamibacterales bacterium]
MAALRRTPGLVAAAVAVFWLTAPAAGGAQAATSPKPVASTTRATVARTRPAAPQRRLTAAQRAERDAAQAKFKRDLYGNLVPDVRAAAAIVYDPGTGEVIWEENAHVQRSIASLTKLMTVTTFMADAPDLTQQVTVASSDVRRASVTYLRAGERVTYRDLLHLTLIASDNGAARVLARTAEGGTKAFIERMNQMAQHLGLTNTHYADPSGLDARNVSTAYDISHLIAYVVGDDRIASIMRKPSYQVHTSRRTVTIRSTNKLLGTEVDVRGGKTGFINAAGYCLATLLQVPQGSQVAVVVLGATNSTLRFWEARHLFNWVVGRSQGVVGGDAGGGATAAKR